MTNSYFLPISKNQEAVYAKIFDYRPGYIFQLIIGDKLRPAFDYCQLSEDREFIVFVGKGCAKYLNDQFEEFVKVEIEDKRHLETVLKALRIKFPNAHFFASVPKQLKRSLKAKFPNVVFILDDYCFDR